MIPILTRLTISTTQDQVRIDRPFETHNGFALAHARDDQGNVARITPVTAPQRRSRPSTRIRR